MKKTSRFLGAHVSASGGLAKALDRAVAIGANTLQLFSGSPRVWKRKDLTAFNTEKLFSKIQENSFGPIITHSLYLVNLASDKTDLVEKSVMLLKYDMAFDAMIGGAGIVVHLGSHQGRGWDVVRDQVAAKIAEIITDSPANSTFLIENSAGQKGKLCSDLAEIRWLIDAVRAQLPKAHHQQLGWCFDTCHAFAAGYPLAPDSDCLADSGSLLDQTKPPAGQVISELELWPDLKCVHVNDSKDPFDSGRDRHQNLGQGSIPVADFQHFLNLPELIELNIPLILEVPGLDGNGPDKPNLDLLKTWVASN